MIAMPFVEGGCREQIRIASMDSQVADESLVRIIDVFVDSLELIEMGLRARPGFGRRSSGI